MWMPTHVQVVVYRATGLLIKGKNNTNDCFVTIALGKTKYQTSIKEKAESDVEWHEECELPIPDQGNRAEIVLTALHRNFLGVDEFLGRVTIPLNELDVYERPKGRWYTLLSKPGQESKNKSRGQLEVKIAFTVKAGSLTDLSKKEKQKSSITHLTQVAHSVGGSLLSLGSIEKRKGIKKIAKSLGSKIHLKGKKKSSENDDSSSIGSVSSLQQSSSSYKSKQTREDADPGVVSDDDDFAFDELSHKSSSSSINHLNNRSTGMGSLENLPANENVQKNTNVKSDQATKDEWDLKLGVNKKKNLKSSNESFNKIPWDSSKVKARIEEEDSFQEEKNTSSPNVESNKKEETMLSKFKNIIRDKEDRNSKLLHSSDERIIIGGENDSKKITSNARVSAELLQKFEGRNREDLILIINELQSELEYQKRKNKDLEDYLDELLLKVMETTPRILQNPYAECRMHVK